MCEDRAAVLWSSLKPPWIEKKKPRLLEGTGISEDDATTDGEDTPRTVVGCDSDSAVLSVERFVFLIHLFNFPKSWWPSKSASKPAPAEIKQEEEEIQEAPYPRFCEEPGSADGLWKINVLLALI